MPFRPMWFYPNAEILLSARSRKRMTAWISYLVASDDPGDKAIFDEFCALSWEHGQTSQWMLTTKDSITREALSRIAELHEKSDEIQGRIHARAVDLMKQGKQLADDAAMAAWDKWWHPLAQTPPRPRRATLSRLEHLARRAS